MKENLNKTAVQRIAQSISAVNPEFAQSLFIKDASNGLAELELKQRVTHVIEALSKHLPEDFTQAANILRELPDHWVHGDESDPYAVFAAWPVIDFVAWSGLDFPETSLDLLKRLTPLFSAEFAIRPFIKQHHQFTFKTLSQWRSDNNEHVRRLVSEGTRPRLPWGEQLTDFIKNPAPVIELLEALKDDPSEYVRRSVANNLNDIAKDHPMKVIATCKRWSVDADKNRQWLIRHACRGLIKAGHPEVFPLLGYTKNPKIEITEFKLKKKLIRIGEPLEFHIKLHSPASKRQKFVLDYSIHFMKSNGKLSPKVFKLRNMEMEPGQTLTINKTHAIKPITTRKYYPGKQVVEVIINGTSHLNCEFQLTP